MLVDVEHEETSSSFITVELTGLCNEETKNKPINNLDALFCQTTQIANQKQGKAVTRAINE